MKKLSYAAVSLLSVSTLALSPLAASANPIERNYSLVCPSATGAENVIGHYGNRVAGNGLETVDNNAPRQIWFESRILPAYVPDSFTNYANSSVQYSSDGMVTCNYMSSNADEPSIAVQYQLTNVAGAAITRQTNNSISLVAQEGFKH
jgi:hypothetical protein